MCNLESYYGVGLSEIRVYYGRFIPKAVWTIPDGGEVLTSGIYI